ncbi:aminoacylase-1-like [Drosophila tropicalis]|uniref:aminoacylase-1-like n=1 Tax=Drosophila tropicalis TaxID=46794 RepID=UPI0035AB9C2D
MLPSTLEANKEIQIFREYLRIPSVLPDVNYTDCVAFLKRQAASINLAVDVVYPAKQTKPVVIMKWLGSQPELPSILLNSHMDVVPVFPDKWTQDPFGAHLDSEGRIFARGSQDMKCVGTQYLAAIRCLKANGYRPKRTVYLSYVPDEEIGGVDGMKAFVKCAYFQKMNVGFSMDEGVGSTNDTFNLFYGERTLWHLTFRSNGTAGHGSLLLNNTAGVKLHYVISKMMEFRATQLNCLNANQRFSIGDVTTVNLTGLSGGVQSNVIPPVFEATFDIRLATTVNVEAFEERLRQWCTEAGGDIELIFTQKNPHIKPTTLDESNPFWVAYKAVVDKLGLKVMPLVCPGATDSRFIRELGIPAIGFSPIINTPILLHDHDEYLRAENYLEGIKIFEKLISSVANV